MSEGVVMSDVAARLARAGRGGVKKDLPPAKRIREFDGQTVTVFSVKTVSTGGKYGDSIIATYILEDGSEVDVWQTGNSGKQLKEVADLLPLELKVESFDTEFGNRGYKYVAV
jgi:hypothetical protein